MMISCARVATFRVAPKLLSRNVVALGPRCCMNTLADTLKSKKKVEEDRYIKAQEAARAKLVQEKKAAEEAVVQATQAEVYYDEQVVPVMDEISAMLDDTGDSISPEGLEIIARWKLGK